MVSSHLFHFRDKCNRKRVKEKKDSMNGTVFGINGSNQPFLNLHSACYKHLFTLSAFHLSNQLPSDKLIGKKYLSLHPTSIVW